LALSKTTRKWLRYAMDDLKVVRALETLGSSYWRACTYHAQQTVEKAIKAYLTNHLVRFPKTHDIGKLAELTTNIDPKLGKKILTAKRLTKYAIEYRYPSAAKNAMTKNKVRSATKLAEKIYELIATGLRGR
jgi:HEPN domain-containing protein